jgi:hypothetical protein
MPYLSPSDRRPRRRLGVAQLSLAAAVAPVAALVAAVAFVAAAPAAHAAPTEFSGAAGTASTAADFPPAPGPALRAVPWQRAADAAVRVPPAGLSTASSRPKDGITGIFITDPIHATWSSANGTADVQVAAVENLNASGTTGDIVLRLVATTTAPVDGAEITYQTMASYDLGPLPAGNEFSGIDTGEITYREPTPANCYYVSVALFVGNNTYLDIRPFTSGGTLSAAQTNGFVTFPIGEPSGQACPYATPCVETATSACLLGGRFQVSAAYDNTTNGIGSGSVLSFGGTRAESDESVFFYFTDPSNFEMGAKILDACSVNNSFWFFFGGLTNQGFGVDVLDTQTGNHHYYLSNDGTTAVTVTDTASLPCP